MTLPWKVAPPKCVFISGGGSGIGRELAHRLAAEGADIAIFNRKLALDVVQELKNFAASPDQRFKSYCTDVANNDMTRETIALATKEFGAPDLAINSAGMGIAKEFTELSSEEFNRVIHINLIGSRNFAAAVIPHMREGSHLVFMASLASLVGTFAYTAYCASKFGVMGLASALRVELKLNNIDVSICCPGEIITPFVIEERKTSHPILVASKAFAGHQEVDVACEQMLRGIAKRHFEIVGGTMPRLTAFLGRHFPALTRLVADDIARKAAKKMTGAKHGDV